MVGRIILSLTLLLLVGCSGHWSLEEKNDFFTFNHSDQNYSQGLSFVGLYTEQDVPETLKKVISKFPVGTEKTHTDLFEVEFGQDIYTPDDIRETELIVDDNPYVGWLYGKAERHVFVEDSVRKSTALYVGAIGDYSFGREVQTAFHKAIDNQLPNGWDNQLKNEVTFYVQHEREYLLSHKPLNKYLDLGISSNVTGRAGTLHDDLAFGYTVRVGKNLPYLGFEIYETPWSYHWYFNPRFRGVARNLFYDGNTFRDSHSVDTEHLVAEANSGIVLKYYKWSFAFRVHGRTRDYSEQKRSFHTFGGFDINRNF